MFRTCCSLSFAYATICIYVVLQRFSIFLIKRKKARQLHHIINKKLCLENIYIYQLTRHVFKPMVVFSYIYFLLKKYKELLSSNSVFSSCYTFNRQEATCPPNFPILTTSSEYIKLLLNKNPIQSIHSTFRLIIVISFILLDYFAFICKLNKYHCVKINKN